MGDTDLRGTYLKLVGAALAALPLIAAQSAEDAPKAGQPVKLEARTRGGQTEFQVGELIELELSFSAAQENAYQISTANYDRTGRLGIERYEVEPQTGWDDPLQIYYRSYHSWFGGGLSSNQVLSAKATLIHRDLNEWVRFQTGRYRLVVVSSRSGKGTELFPSEPGPPMELRSNELWLTIVPATPEWQEETLRNAVGVLDQAAKNTPNAPRSEQLERAVARLRYLGTAGAAREMVRRLGDEKVAPQFRLGLAATPARDAALDEFQKRMVDPAAAISVAFLETMSLVATTDESETGRADAVLLERDKLLAQLLAALPDKRGGALATSAATAVSELSMRRENSTPEQKRSLTQALLTGFESLPPRTQSELLDYRWGQLQGQAMLPVLERLSKRYQESEILNISPVYEQNQASLAALRRWAEVDPAGAREQILTEMSRPHPRFGGDALGMLLGDREMPEMDQLLVGRLRNTTGDPGPVATLIARFGTAAILPQINSYLDENLGTISCAVQNPLIAYVRRVDAVSGNALAKRAMAERGPNKTGCYRMLVSELSQWNRDGALEQLAADGLEDPDPMVVRESARYLQNYGSATAEAPLWSSLEAWHQRAEDQSGQSSLGGKETREQASARTEQMGVGYALVTALTNGKGWLATPDRLRRLMSLTAGTGNEQLLELMLKAWQEPAQTLVLFGNGKRP